VTVNQINPKVSQYMGLTPKRKLESILEMLSSGVTVSLLTTGSSRIYSHKLMIIAKRENHTNRTYNKRAKG